MKVLIGQGHAGIVNPLGPTNLFDPSLTAVSTGSSAADNVRVEG
jgi:hypothetical protein